MKKKLYGLLVLICLSTTIFAQLPVVVTGILNKQRIVPVKLFKVNDGGLEEISSTQANSELNFGFIFYPEYEGWYVIGTGAAISPTDNHIFYFKGGDKLSLTLNENNYELNGNANSKENILLKEWFRLTESVCQKSVNFMRSRSTYVDFFPELEELVIKSKTFMNGKSSGNIRFDKRMVAQMQMDLANYASNFINTPRSIHPDVAQFSTYYKDLNAAQLSKTTAKIYNYPWGTRVLESVMMINMRQKKMPFVEGIEGVKQSLGLIANDTLKGDFVLKRMAGLKSYTEYTDYANTFAAYILTKRQKEKQKAIALPLATLKPGDIGFNFSYPDPNGKNIAMADLKGKVVLIDVWATWCGPCKEQIPYLKKLEEEMKGKDVQIVSISVDEAKDKDKWLKMIKDKELGGLQLFASGWGDIAAYYKIDGIPRFMVFDKAGKIVDVNAPRPSTPELKALLEKTLVR